MKAYYQQPQQDQWALRVAHYMPWLTHWWITQKWFPTSSVVARNPHIFSLQDFQIIPKISGRDLHKVHINLFNFTLLHVDLLHFKLHIATSHDTLRKTKMISGIISMVEIVNYS